MQALPKLRLLRFVEQAYHLARRAVARNSSKFSKRQYTLHQHIVLLCLKVRKNTAYQTVLDELIEMPRIRSAIELEEIPTPSTFCRAFNRLDMAVWHVLLSLSVTLLPMSGVVGSDASGFDRSHASKHYTKRTKLMIQQLKLTLLVDTKSNVTIESHVTTTRKHDLKIAPSLIKLNTGDVAILLGDKRYDDQKIRALARRTGVRSFIKHCEFSSLHKAWNARLDSDLYGQRSQNETLNSRLKRKYGAFIRSQC